MATKRFEQPDQFSLSAAEILAILGFWTVLAVITAASRRIDPRIDLAPQIATAVVTLSFLEYAIWAVLTVPIVWLASRFSIEQGHRLARIAFFIVLGVLIAVLVDSTLSAARAHLLPPPPTRRFPRPGNRFTRLEFLDDLMIYFAVLGAGIARDYFNRYRSRQEETTRLQAHTAQLETQLAHAELAALRNQLNPHFLFNTLHAVSALVERDPKGVRRMISRLSELLRFTLEGSHQQETTLENEIDLVRRYVEIMEIRFQGRLDVRTAIDESVGAALVPTLLLQPIVENAIKHGIGESENHASIMIRARRDEDQLIITVSDNGKGVSAGPDSAGVGLRNTKARLTQLYGSAQHFSLTNNPDSGAVAEIRLPYHMKPVEEGEVSQNG